MHIQFIRRVCLALTATSLVLLTSTSSRAVAAEFISGVDISMLPSIEKAGGIYQDNNKPGDAIAILKNHGCNMFRVRLFVNPDPDFSKTDGAIQDLAYVRTLAKRIKAAGGGFMLDIHYSDTWADPGKQFTPAAWKSLDFDALKQKVGEYTTAVLADLKANDVTPDMVQVGNEITAGILWPLGNVLNVPADKQDLQWKRFAELENAGAAAVRAASTPAHPIRIIIHIHGGGRPGLPKWFFGKFMANPVDFDVMGLSFYPAWNDSIDDLKQNMDDIIHTYNKDVIVAETSYPWRTMQDVKSPAMQWPQTKDGQKQFLQDLTKALKAAPDHHGIGFMWWYPEAIPIPTLRIWRNGAEGLFDEKGNALPAMDMFGAGNN